MGYVCVLWVGKCLRFVVAVRYLGLLLLLLLVFICLWCCWCFMLLPSPWVEGLGGGCYDSVEICV